MCVCGMAPLRGAESVSQILPLLRPTHTKVSSAHKILRDYYTIKYNLSTYLLRSSPRVRESRGFSYLRYLTIHSHARNSYSYSAGLPLIRIACSISKRLGLNWCWSSQAVSDASSISLTLSSRPSVSTVLLILSLISVVKAYDVCGLPQPAYMIGHTVEAKYTEDSTTWKTAKVTSMQRPLGSERHTLRFKGYTDHPIVPGSRIRIPQQVHGLGRGPTRKCDHCKKVKHRYPVGHNYTKTQWEKQDLGKGKSRCCFCVDELQKGHHAAVEIQRAKNEELQKQGGGSAGRGGRGGGSGDRGGGLGGSRGRGGRGAGRGGRGS
jgi:uncharacterized membrane protein YgcG